MMRLPEKARDDSLRGDPNIYRLTAVALGAMGYTSPEAFQPWAADFLDWRDHRDGTGPRETRCRIWPVPQYRRDMQARALKSINAASGGQAP